MELSEILNMAEPITIPETSVVKNEVEEALPSDHEELFDFPTHLLSPKREDALVGSFCCFSGPYKLEPDTQELSSTCFDSKAGDLSSIGAETIRETSTSTLSSEYQQLPVGAASRITSLTSESDSQSLDNNDEVRSRAPHQRTLLKGTDSLQSDDALDMSSTEDNLLHENQYNLPYKRRIAALIDHDYTTLNPSRWKRPYINVRSRSLFSSPLLKESGSLASNDDLEVLSSGDNSSYEDQGLLPYKRHVPALLDHDYIVLYPSSRKKHSRIEAGDFSPIGAETIRETSISILSSEYQQLPVGAASRITSLTSESDSQSLDDTDKEIINSTVCSADVVDQPKLFGPKPIVKVKKLTDKAIGELTAGIWRCASCAKAEKSSFMLDLHKDTGCEDFSPIECDICPAIFRDYRNFVVHKIEHQMGETRRCPICLCECIGDMSQHLVIYGHFSPSASELERQGTTSLDVTQNSSHVNNWKRHQKVHTGEKLFECEVCEKTFFWSNNLIKHQRVHTGEKPFKCDIYKKYFSESSSLITHQRVHTGEKPFKCDICEKNFSKSGSLIKHQRVHTGEKPFKCGICDKAFSESSYLIRHQRVHTGEKPFKCDICEKTFSQSSHLIRHQRVHTGEKPFKCDICDKTFSQSGNLIQHQRVHTGEKPFKCGICDKAFSLSSSLINHQIVHTGKKPFKCDICKREYSSKLNLNDHITTHSQKKPASS